MTSDLRKLHLFLDIVFDPADHIALSCFPEPRSRAKTVKSYNRVLQLKQLKAHITLTFLKQQQQARRNVCISPNPIKPGKTRKNENISRLNAIYIDIDDAQRFSPSDIMPPPHLILQRLQKFHVYWLLDKSAKPTQKNLQTFEKVEKILINRYGADVAVKDPARALRCPYTAHVKGKDSRPYKVILYNNQAGYNLQDLLHSLVTVSPNVSQKFPAAENQDIVSPNVKQIAPVENFTVNENYITDFIFAKFAKRGEIFEGDGRSLHLFFAGLDCFGWGLDIEKAVKIAEKINKKLCKPPETTQIVRHQVQSAYKYSKTGFGEYKTAINEAEGDKERQKALKQHREAHRIREVLKNWVYVASAERLINLVTGQELTTATGIGNYLYHLCAARISIGFVLQYKLIRVCEELDFRPDIDKRIYSRQNGVNVLNRFQGFLPVRIDTETRNARHAISIFVKHLKFLTNDQKEFEAVQNFFAYIIQNPGAKLPYSILMISRKHGIGKSLLEKLFKNIYEFATGCTYYVGSIENRQLTRGFTHYMADRILVFIHEIAQGDRDAMMNQLKSLITEPTVEIEGKYAKPYEVKNTVNFVMFSNRATAMRIDKHDRRLFVIQNDKEPENTEYYSALVAIIDNDASAIYGHLKEINLTGFNPYVRPAMTRGKIQLIEQSATELDLYLQNSIKEQRGPFKHPIFTAFDILNYVEMMGTNTVKRFVSLKSVKNFLIENNYIGESLNCRIENRKINRVYYSLREPDGCGQIRQLKKSGKLKTILDDILGKEEGVFG